MLFFSKVKRKKSHALRPDEYVGYGVLYHSFRVQETLNKFTLASTCIVMNKRPNSKISCMFAFFLNLFHNVNTQGRRQSKTLLKSMIADQKSLETVFSIAICRRSDDNLQSKTLFLTILIYVRR